MTIPGYVLEPLTLQDSDIGEEEEVVLEEPEPVESQVEFDAKSLVKAGQRAFNVIRTFSTQAEQSHFTEARRVLEEWRSRPASCLGRAPLGQRAC